MNRIIKTVSKTILFGFLTLYVSGSISADTEKIENINEDDYRCLKEANGEKEEVSSATTEYECTEQSGTWEKVETM